MIYLPCPHCGEEVPIESPWDVYEAGPAGMLVICISCDEAASLERRTAHGKTIAEFFLWDGTPEVWEEVISSR